MKRNISSRLLIEELKVLEIALKNNGIISQRDLEKNHLNYESIFAPLDMGHLKPEKEEFLPNCDYYITESGKKYFNESLEFMHNYPLKKD